MVAGTWRWPAGQQLGAFVSQRSQSLCDILVVCISLRHLVFCKLVWKIDFTYLFDEIYLRFQKLQNEAICAYKRPVQAG
ncbi:hypothetical protein [Comamonas sp. JUb58]|uniref:hypothetical protein n=1 Tax=Comamonas sp. JUb58 TaxID=2485114 RepID=UPI00105D5E46|nr:hypothetical protein [Comamonas sp. JUb58]TDS82180.1 hypothetical protein EDF71_10896 [Comamonas sp. JUb58]